MVDRFMSKSDSEGERRQREMAKGQEELVLAPNLGSGIGKAGLGVGTALVGSGEYVAEGIDTFILSGYPHLEEAQRFGKYVMPHFVGERSEPRVPELALAHASG